jgi:hypothetical protein
MELLKKVKSLEVKRCYVLAQTFTSKKMRKAELKKQIAKPTRETFSKDLALKKQAVLKWKESQLDSFIATEYKKRLKAYDNMTWHIGYVELSEIGIWKGAGGIPKEWTKGSLQDTAELVALELKKSNSKYLRIRAMKVVPEIVISKATIKKEKYLLPIILPGGTISSCRKGMRKMKGDIDDGCMRSLAFVISGDRKLKAYIGSNPKKSE